MSWIEEYFYDIHTGLFFTTLFRVPLRTQNVWKTMLVLLLEEKCFLCVPSDNGRRTRYQRYHQGWTTTGDAWVSSNYLFVF